MKLANQAARSTPSRPAPSLTDTQAPAKAAPKQQPLQQATRARATPHSADGFDTKRPDARAQVLLGAPAPLPSPAAAKQAGSVTALKFGDPAFAVAQPTGAESAASEATQIDSVTGKRADIEGAQAELFTQTQAEADRIFAMGSGAEKLPPNTTVTMTAPNVAVLTQMDETGTHPVSVTTATRHEDGRVQLDTVRQAGERFERDSVLAGVDSSTVQHADWKATEGATVTTAPSLEDLRQARDPDVLVTENSVWRQDGNLHTRDYVQKDGGVQQSETEFSQTTEHGEVADDFRGMFNRDAPTDVAHTRAYSIPPPSADGTTQPPVYTDVKSWSQSGLQVTKTDSRPLDFESEFDVGNQPHTLADLEQVVNTNREEDGEKFKGSPEYPRSWLLEKSTPGEYKSQSFIEGSKDATIVLSRRAEGNKVIEEYSGKTFSTDSEVKGLVEVSGSTTNVYGEDGSLMSMSAHTKNPDGSSTKQTYDRTNTPARDGLHMLEKSSIEQTDKEGQTFYTETQTDSVLSGEGLQLKSTETKTRAPDGTQARSRMDGKGESYFLTDPGSTVERQVTDPAQLPTDPNTQEALLQATISNAMTVQNFATKGGQKSLELMYRLGKAGGMNGGEPVPYEKVLSGGYKLFGNDAVNRALQGGAGIAGALGGAAGVAGNGMLLMQGVREKNMPTIIQGAVMMGLSGYDMYQGGTAFMNAMKGIKTVDIADDALRMPTWFAKVPGLAGLSKSAGALRVLGVMNSGLKAVGGIGTVIGVGLGAYDVFEGIKKGNGWQVAKGTVGIAGTIAGAVATGAVAGSIGGPLGAAAGAIAGIAIGVFTWGIGKIIDIFNNTEHDTAPVRI